MLVRYFRPSVNVTIVAVALLVVLTAWVHFQRAQTRLLDRCGAGQIVIEAPRR